MKKTIKILNIILILIAVLLSYLIFSKKNIQFNVLKKIFEATYNYINVGSTNQKVSSFMYFVPINKNQYYNEYHEIYSPQKSTILSVDDESITLKCENGYHAYFGNLLNIQVTNNDVIYPSFAIANFDDYFIFYFYKNGVVYSYEEIMGNN